jgi:hypothetical protein
MKLNNEIIAAFLSATLNAAGILLLHAKVEADALIFTAFVSSTMMWLSFFLILEHIKEGNKLNLDFWCYAVVMPIMLPVGLWACILFQIYY